MQPDNEKTSNIFKHDFTLSVFYWDSLFQYKTEIFKKKRVKLLKNRQTRKKKGTLIKSESICLIYFFDFQQQPLN